MSAARTAPLSTASPPNRTFAYGYHHNNARYPGTNATVAMAETAGAITEPTAYPTAPNPSARRLRRPN